MMRFLSPSLLHELWRHCHPLASTVTHSNRRLFPITCALSLYYDTFSRPLYSGCSLRKDVPQPQVDQSVETEKLDLDVWKSVLRSQAKVEDKKNDTEKESIEVRSDLTSGETGSGGGAEAAVGSLLESTRELVVMWREAGKLVPEHMTVEEVRELSELTTKSSKKKYLKYLAIREGHKKARKVKQEKKKIEREESMVAAGEGDLEEEEEEGHKLKNSFLLQFWGRSLDKLLGWRSAQAMVFGQPLVFDMSYELNMARREVENTVSQLMEVEGWNRRARDPFHLHFCNLQPDGTYKRELLKRYGSEAWERLLITDTERRHVDMFPSEHLVYLTADSPNVLRTYDHSKVYIVGSFVDRSIQTGASLANAKRLKLATARLPLDEYLDWDIGAKNLTLDQMMRILLTMKETDSWEQALEFVPKRKHDGFYQQQSSSRERSRDRNATPDRPGRSTRMFDSEVPVVDRRGNYSRDRSWDRDGDRVNMDRDQRFHSRTSFKDTEYIGGVREKDRKRTVTGLTGEREDRHSALMQLRTALKSRKENDSAGRKQKNTWWEEE